MLVPVLICVAFYINYVSLPVFYNNKIDSCLNVSVYINTPNTNVLRKNLMGIINLQYLQMRFDRKTRQFVSFSFFLTVMLMLPVCGYIPAMAFSQGK